ncbi:MAG: inner membrane protein [Gammaproteobacteria bacterium]|jgi:inner membrane protein
MDPVSHALLGALIGSCATGRTHVRAGASVGAIAALVPDVDVLIRSSTDPLLAVEFHRQFSHSLLVVPVIALLVSALCWPLARRYLTGWDLLRASALACASAMLLDACTSYGTMLMWPFSQQRTALNIVAIVDPLFTLVLATALAFTVIGRARMFALWGISLGTIYLGFGWLQHERALFVAETLANDRGHEVEQLVAKPTLGNLILWRTVYLSKGDYHVDAVRISPSSDIEIYPGTSVPKFTNEQVLVANETVQSRDIERFARLSQQYNVIHPNDPFVIGDVRYALLPNSVLPLWGIRVDPLNQDSHVSYETFRHLNERDLSSFIDMLLGAPSAHTDN